MMVMRPIRKTSYFLVPLMIVFSIEMPLNIAGSAYASINSEDFAVLLVFGLFLFDHIRRRDWRIGIRFPRVTAFMALVTGWIVLGVLIAEVRSSATASLLWTLKWFEGLVFFIVIQDQLDSDSGTLVVRALLFSGILLATYAVVASLLGGYRIRVFFGNPNTLSGFFILIALVCLTYGFTINDRTAVMYYAASILAILAVLSTGSRSGLLGLISGIVFFGLLTNSRYSRRQLGISGGGVLMAFFSAVFIIQEDVWRRLTGWFTVENGRIMLADTPVARSFRIRLNLIDKAIALFQQRPIIGHGWFASPSRVGFLDVHYTTLLVELGIVGFILMMLLYVSLIRAWVNARKEGIFMLASAGAAWYGALLVQSIGGNFPRNPQTVLLTLLFLTATEAVGQGSWFEL